MNTQSKTVPETQVSGFITPRHGGNSWAQSRKLTDAWKAGSFWDVSPLSMEFAMLLECNADCGLCPYRRSRNNEHLDIVEAGQFPAENDITVTTRETAERVVTRAVQAGVRGILWTGGGEPTIWRPLVGLLRYSASAGILSALYTNGIRLGNDHDLATNLMQPEAGMVFVRVSVNAVSPRTIKLHWGIAAEEIESQFNGLAALFRAREALLPSYTATGRCPPSIQISTILDKNNIHDMLGICQKVAEIASVSSTFRGSEDVMVVRPLTIHGRREYSAHDHDDKVIREIIRIGGNGGEGRAAIEQAGLRLFLGFGLSEIESGQASRYSELINKEYSQRDCSWSNGVFLTVGPGGIVYPCTELNCNRNWALGDLKTQSVEEIYHGPRRRDFVTFANQHKWGPTVVQPTARTNRLDRIARAIMTGQLTDTEIEHIRQLSLESHTLLLD